MKRINVYKGYLAIYSPPYEGGVGGEAFPLWGGSKGEGLEPVIYFPVTLVIQSMALTCYDTDRYMEC